MIKMVEIKAGFDLDMAVAEACGLTVSGSYDHDLSRNVCLLLPSVKSFDPSTDLNDAFYAAERVASDHYGCVELPPCITLDNRTGWKCTIEDSPEGRGKTAALAICAAILALSKVG